MDWALEVSLKISSPSSTPTQSFHPPRTSALAAQTHYPTFPRIVIPPQSHTPHLNTRMGTSELHKRAQLRMTIFIMGSDVQYTTTIEQHDVGDESNSSFQGQTNLYSIISCNIHGLNTKKQKHKVQLISELANNENTLSITLTEAHLHLKNTWLTDTNEELHWISCRSNLR